MTYRTTKEAASMLCPIARISARPSKNPDEVPTHCCAEACMFWRWRGLDANDHRFKSAVARETILIEGTRSPDRKYKRSATSEAVQKVGYAADRDIIRDDNDLGWCGLAGRPE